MNFLEKIVASSKLSMFQFLGILTLIQFWWIAVWGLAYIAIDFVAGDSKIKQILIYLGFLLAVILALQIQPKLVEKL
jgi:hypothetical protein